MMNEMMTRDEMVKMHNAKMEIARSKYEGWARAAMMEKGLTGRELEFEVDQIIRAFAAIAK